MSPVRQAGFTAKCGEPDQPKSSMRVLPLNHQPRLTAPSMSKRNATFT